VYSRNWLNSTAALFAAAALAGSAHAVQDGAYDPDFGSVGRTWFDVTSSTSDSGSKLIQLSGGKFFMTGKCGDAGCAIWLTPSGTLATGYGTVGSGKAWFTDFTGWPVDASDPTDAAAFPDGRVAVATYGSIGHSYVAMLRTDGTGLDPAVGNGAGYVSPSFTVKAMRVTSNQQLIVAGEIQASKRAFIVARYDSTLHLDTSFGSGGSTTIGFADGDAFLNGMTLQRDGKIVVIGAVSHSPYAIGIVRLTANGVPDADFGVNSDGRFESTFGTTYGVGGTDIVEDKQGRLVFVGGERTDNVYEGQWFVDRLLGGGATDAAFNGGQPLRFTIVQSATLYSPHPCCVALQSDARIVVAGSMHRDGTQGYYFAIARLFDNGAFDPSYGGGGQSYGDMSTQAPNVMSDYPSSMVISGGGIVVGGATQLSSYETGFSVAKARIDLLFAADFD